MAEDGEGLGVEGGGVRGIEGVAGQEGGGGGVPVGLREGGKVLEKGVG